LDKTFTFYIMTSTDLCREAN